MFTHHLTQPLRRGGEESTVRLWSTAVTERRALPAWLLPAYFVALCVGFFVVRGTSYFRMTHVDLPSFWGAAQLVFNRGESPFSLDALRAITADDTTFPWLYPPPSLFVFAPLAAVPYATAQTLVLALNHVLLVVLAWLIPLGLLKLDPRRDVLAIAACLTFVAFFGPVFVTLYNGQTNLLVTLAVVVFWLAARDHRDVIAALALTLAVLLKTYPLILLPLLFIIGRRKLVLLTLGALALVALASLGLPAGLWTDWWTKVVPAGGYGATPHGLFAPDSVFNQSLHGVFSRLQLAPLTWLASALVLAVTTLATVRRRELEYVVSLALPAVFLIAPVSWEHHLVTLLPVIAVLAFSRTQRAFTVAVIITALVLSPEALLPLKGVAVIALWGLALIRPRFSARLEISSQSPAALR